MAKQARKWITVNVTEVDILEGVANNCNSCPIARAFKRAVPELTYVAVGCVGIRWVHDNSDWTTDLPEEAVRFIHRFDHGEPVEPFKFILHLKDVYYRGAL